MAIEIEPGFLQCDGPYCLATFKAPRNTSESHELARLPIVWVRKKAREQGWVTLTVDRSSGIKLPPATCSISIFVRIARPTRKRLTRRTW